MTIVKGCTTACSDHGPHRTHRKILWCDVRSVHHRIQLMAGCPQAGTMFELSGVLDKGTQQLTDRVPNSISLNAGCELFNLFVTVATHDLGVRAPLSPTSNPDVMQSPLLRASPTSRISSSGKGTGTSQRPPCTARRLLDLPADSSRMDQWYGSHLCTDVALFFFSHVNAILRQILTHSYSRVVMRALLHAHKRKRISVYVTEGRVSNFLPILYLTTRGFKLNHEGWGKLRRQVNE